MSSAGLDEPSTRRLLQALEDAKEAGTTIVLVAHDLALVRAVADTVTVLDAGTVIARGTADRPRADLDVRGATGRG